MKKKNGGFTLIEVITAMGITIVLIAVVMTVVLTAMSSVGDTVTTEEKNNIATSIYNLIENSVRDAKAVSHATMSVEGERCLTVDANGYILLDDTEVYDRTHYQDGGCSYNLTISGDKAELSVTVGGYTINGGFRLMNIKLESPATETYTQASSLYYSKVDGGELMSQPESVTHVAPGEFLDSQYGWTTEEGTLGGGFTVDSTPVGP